MSNPRDTGRYDSMIDGYVDRQVRVDFAWGNMPMQPNDDRGENTLDSELDSHIIATSQYEGFPAFTTGAPYDDTIPNVEVPNLIEMTLQQADAALSSAQLSSDLQTTTVGATSGNNGTVSSQTPAAGTLVNINSIVSFTTYNYVSAANPIAAISNNDIALAANDFWMYLLGRTIKPTVGDFIHVMGTGDTAYSNNNYEVISVENDDSFNTGGTKVKIQCVTGTVTPTGYGTSNGGTWTKL